MTWIQSFILVVCDWPISCWLNLSKSWADKVCHCHWCQWSVGYSDYVLRGYQSLVQASTIIWQCLFLYTEVCVCPDNYSIQFYGAMALGTVGFSLRGGWRPKWLSQAIFETPLMYLCVLIRIWLSYTNGSPLAFLVKTSTLCSGLLMHVGKVLTLCVSTYNVFFLCFRRNYVFLLVFLAWNGLFVLLCHKTCFNHSCHYEHVWWLNIHV